jgi:hypothetical protein
MSSFRIFAKDSGRFLGQVDAVDERAAREAFFADHPKIEVDVTEEPAKLGQYAPGAPGNLAVGNSAMSSTPTSGSVGNGSRTALLVIWLVFGIAGIVMFVYGASGVVRQGFGFDSFSSGVSLQLVCGIAFLAIAVLAIIGHLVVNAVITALDQRS